MVACHAQGLAHMVSNAQGFPGRYQFVEALFLGLVHIAPNGDAPAGSGGFTGNQVHHPAAKPTAHVEAVQLFLLQQADWSYGRVAGAVTAGAHARQRIDKDAIVALL